MTSYHVTCHHSTLKDITNHLRGGPNLTPKFSFDMTPKDVKISTKKVERDQFEHLYMYYSKLSYIFHL